MTFVASVHTRVRATMSLWSDGGGMSRCESWFMKTQFALSDLAYYPASKADPVNNVGFLIATF